MATATVSRSRATARPAPNSKPRTRPALKVAPDVSRRRRRARLAMWGVTLVTAASLFALVGFHVLAAQSSFTLDKLARERTNEQLRYERLREQVAELSSPQAITAQARDLGLVFTPNPAWIVAPAAAPQSVKPDPGQETLQGTYQPAKPHLDGNP